MTTIPALSIVEHPDQAGALLDPTRRELLERLREPDSAAGLARRMRLPRQRLNYHLRELERAGLVECVGERRKGNCTERLMRATARAFVISPAVLGSLGSSPEAGADRVSAATLVAAAAETIRSVAALERRAKREGKRLATLTLESEIRFASAAARAAFAEELTQAVARLVARFHDDRAPRGRRFRLVVGAHPAVTAPTAEKGAQHD
jgi:DNA-binding transcriptional ArsR family regulator